MRTMMHLIAASVLLAALAVATGAPEPKEETASPVYPLDAKIAGKTYRDWSVAWFRWVFGIERDRSPILDKTGEFAGEGQTGPVWFLGGNLGGETKRKLTVPAGKPIFSTVLNSFGHAPAEGARKNMAAELEMEVTLNGKSLGDMSRNRVDSGPFEFVGLEKSKAVHPLLAGESTMSLYGYWFMLKPLPAGDHTLRIKGKVPSAAFELDITYQLKVVKSKKT